MAWTSPRTWVTGEVVTDAELNAHVRDNENYLLANGVQNTGATVSHLESGTWAPGSTNNGVTVTNPISFARVFTATPVIVVSMNTGNASNPYILDFFSASTAQFTARFVNSSGVTHTAPVINWMAYGPSAQA